jgi:hypothetical protein
MFSNIAKHKVAKGIELPRVVSFERIRIFKMKLDIIDKICIMKGDFGMLNKYSLENIELIRMLAKEVFNDDINFGEMEEIDSPFPEFTWLIILYKRINALLTYDRSMLRVDIMINGEYKYIRYVANAPKRKTATMTRERVKDDFLLLREVSLRLLKDFG